MSHPGEVVFLKGAVRPAQYPPEGLPEVAFVGRSNVGKSSLINTLVERKGLARTSQAPGKTRLVHFYRVGDRLVFVDLPGYGYARVPEAIRRQWRPMVEAYLLLRGTLSLVVFLLDLRRIPSDHDLQLKEWLAHHGIPTRFVLTKVDKLSRGSRLAQVGKIAQTLGLEADHFICFSARTGEGCRRLWGIIWQAVKDKKEG